MAINWVPSSPSTHSAQTHIHPAIQERGRERERERDMEVVQVLHMNGGIGETSYANNSLVQVNLIN